ncbi:MAG: hypothetical protein AB7S44_01615 [Spirochaetales bacterium]
MEQNMEQINLSNKKLNIQEISDFDKSNIETNCGKPFCGLWFTPALYGLTSHFKSFWHKHIESNWPKDIINKTYVTNNNTTFVTELFLEEDTQILKVSELGYLFDKKASTLEIIKELELKNTKHLILNINSQEDLDIISENYPQWDSLGRKIHSELWEYVTNNFVGCEFSWHLFETVRRLDSDFLFILDTPSFVVFDANGFKFKTTEEKLTFNTFDNKIKAEIEVSL